MNFGPLLSDCRTVREVLDLAKHTWNEIVWLQDTDVNPYESPALLLNSRRANSELSWNSIWDLPTAIHSTISWYRSYYSSNQVQTDKDLMHSFPQQKTKEIYLVYMKFTTTEIAGLSMYWTGTLFDQRGQFYRTFWTGSFSCMVSNWIYSAQPCSNYSKGTWRVFIFNIHRMQKSNWSAVSWKYLGCSSWSEKRLKHFLKWKSFWTVSRK